MRTIHQNPVGDGIRHQARLDCPCRPDTEELLGDSGKWELLVSHRRLEVARIPVTPPAFLEVWGGEYLAPGLGGDPFTVRPIPADIVEKENS